MNDHKYNVYVDIDRSIYIPLSSSVSENHQNTDVYFLMCSTNQSHFKYRNNLYVF